MTRTIRDPKRITAGIASMVSELNELAGKRAELDAKITERREALAEIRKSLAEAIDEPVQFDAEAIHERKRATDE